MAWCGLKTGKKRKKPKKRLAARRKFKGHDNITKHYRRRFTDYQVMLRAEICRQQRLENSTEAELAMEAILRSMGVKYEREKIVQNGDRFVLIDVWLPKWNLAIELDGEGHRLQKNYDIERSMWLARNFSMKTVRFWNRNVMDGSAELRLREMLGLKSPLPIDIAF